MASRVRCSTYSSLTVGEPKKLTRGGNTPNKEKVKRRGASKSVKRETENAMGTQNIVGERRDKTIKERCSGGCRELRKRGEKERSSLPLSPPPTLCVHFFSFERKKERKKR